jgi:hypothetical protein
MDLGEGTKLTKDQWESIHRNCHAFSLYDDYEDVRTNGGLIAYYFWEENAQGEIVWESNRYVPGEEEVLIEQIEALAHNEKLKLNRGEIMSSQSTQQ